MTAIEKYYYDIRKFAQFEAKALLAKLEEPAPENIIWVHVSEMEYTLGEIKKITDWLYQTGEYTK